MSAEINAYAVEAVLIEHNFSDGVINADDIDAQRMATEVVRLRDAIEARDDEIAALTARLAALESVLRGLSCNVIRSEIDGPFLHVRRETGMLLTDHQADAVPRALTTEGDTP